MSCQTNGLLHIWGKSLRSKTALLRNGSLLILFSYIGMAIFAGALSPHDPLQVDVANRLQPASTEFLLGTDSLGRCVLSRLLLGARNSLLSAAVVLLTTVSVGTVVGLFAGFFGGRCDYLVQRLLEGVMAFPGLILALAIAGVLGPGLENAVLALCLVHWVGYARIVRNMTLSLRERTYVQASRIAGASSLDLLRRHILPEVAPAVLVVATLDYGRIIISIAGLSFLGLGAQPPAPEWGAMLSEGKAYMQVAPQLILWPGAMIAGIVLALQLLSETWSQRQ